MDYKERYEYWLNHKDLDKTLKKELNGLKDKEIEDCFFKDIEFETAGMRGLMGVGSNRINIHTVRKATLGLANFLKKNNYIEEEVEKTNFFFFKSKEKVVRVKSEQLSVAIGYDNRYNSYEFAFDCAKLLASNGIKAYVFKSLAPTPELSFAVRYYNCDAGIMITASHNPKEYNGYKVYDENGCQLTPSKITGLIEEINNLEDIISIKPSEDYNIRLIEVIREEVDLAYERAVLGIQLHNDVKKDIKIAYSPEHGASYNAVMNTLIKAGYNVSAVESQKDPDPAFSNTASPNPEELKAYEGVEELAKNIDADIMLVCDPDGDRMGVGVKHKGSYQVLNGNQTGALLLEYILMSHEDLGIKYDNPYMFTTVVTSDLGEKVAMSHNVGCEKTLTGFKYIGDKVAQYEINHEKDYVFGYEESYGSLISPFVRDKDATQACLMLAEACAYYKQNGKTLVDVLDDIYYRVGAYYDTQLSIMLPGVDGKEKLNKIMQDLRTTPLEVPNSKVVKIEDYKLQKYYEGENEYDLLGHDVSDVLKYFFDDGSYIAIRPSGTEPKCKFYFSIKDENIKNAKKKAEKLKEYISELMNDK